MDNTNNKISGFCDSPANQDQLGCENYYDGLAQFIRLCPTPMTIAIQGDWGTGKTTAMKIIENKVKGFGYYPIEFNTWKFSKSSGKMLIVPLINLMIKELDEIGRDNDEYKKECLKNNRLKTILTSIGGLCFLAGKGVLESVSGAGNAISDVTNAAFSADEKVDFFEVADELHKDIQKRINYIKKDDKRIVVFVDDLDRLAPEDAVNLLEDLKNIMDFENCIFVLALDHKIVMQGLTKKYENIDKAYADRYFDKIIQLPFYLPVNSYKIDTFVKELNKQIEILSDGEVVKVVNVLDRFGDNNPRTIKRLLNLMLFYENIGNPFLSEHKVECFAMNLLQLNHIAYYEVISESMHDLHEIDAGRILNEENYYQSYWPSYCDKIENFWVNLERSMEERQKEDTDSRLTPQDVISVVREIVNNDCMLLKELIMATAVTIGNNVIERIKTTEETESLLDQFLKQTFDDSPEFTSYENHTTKVYKVYDNDNNNNNNERYRITLSNRYSDHVNITVRQMGNENISGLTENDKEQLPSEITYRLRQMGDEYHVPVNLKRDDDFCILCEKISSVCMFSVSVKNYKSLLVAGKLLRNLRDNGTLFIPE